MFSIGLHIRTLGPQLMVLCGEVMESLGGGALPEEARHWEAAIRIHSLTSLPVYSLCFGFAVEAVITQLPHLATGYRRLHLWNHKPK